MSRLKQKAFWILAGDITGRGFALLTSLYLARTLGPDFYGLITVAISILGYATWCSDLGLISIGTRETAKLAEKRLFRIIEVFRTKVFLGAVVLLAAATVVWALEMDRTQKQVILGYLFSIIPYVFLLEWYYAGKQEFGKIALSKILNGLLYFALVFLFIQSAGDIELVPVFYAIGVATAAIVLAAFAFQEKPFTLPSRGMHVYKDLIKTSSLLGSGKFFGQMIQLLPPLIIGALLSLQEAGYYGAAFKIVIIAMLVDRVFVNLLLPNLSAEWSRDKNAAGKHLSAVYKLVVIGGSTIALFIAVGAPQIIPFLFGSDYLQSIPLLQSLSILVAITFVNSLFSYGLIAINRDREFFKAMFKGGLIGASFILGFTFFGGIQTAALSVGLAEISITLFTFLQFRKSVSLNYLRPVILCYPAAILLFILTSFTGLPEIAEALICCTLYLLYIFVLRIMEPQQLNWIREKVWSS